MLLESMRAIGYDPSAALADLIDNSITAGASRVSIRFDPGAPCALAIVDDGRGMTRDQLEEAMRHGSRSPNEQRAEGDLGRFGLGLKTASMSQCRRLTVVSRVAGGPLSAMVWDLDDVAATQDWLAGELDPDEISRVPHGHELDAYPQGTLVLWEKLDRIAAGDPGDGSVLGERARAACDHLALVFHRYLAQRPSPLQIEVNLRPLAPIDPFLEEAGSVASEEERIAVEGEWMTLRAFTLPHISRLTRTQIEKAGGEVGLRRQQGFYVYRHRRLIVWGTWFRLFRQEELTKLTRVRVDIPSSLDHLWGIDIKKSVAVPPTVIRDRLRTLVPTMVRPSQRANQYRGRVDGTRGIRTIWTRIQDRDGIRYVIDSEHPIVASLRHNLSENVVSELDNALQAIAATLPLEALYNDRANDQIGLQEPQKDKATLLAHLEDLARQMLGAFDDRPEERSRLLSKLDLIEPFALHPDLISTLQARLRP